MQEFSLIVTQTISRHYFSWKSKVYFKTSSVFIFKLKKKKYSIQIKSHWNMALKVLWPMMLNFCIFLRIWLQFQVLQSLAYLGVSNGKIKQKLCFSFCSLALRICCGKTVWYERLSTFLTNLHKRTLTLFLLSSFPVARSFA